jgi:Protein of unknown function (DUF4236)
MGFRFQKRIKVLPGITLNLSGKGISTSIGTTGARVTFGHGKRRVTTGIPGSGISHTTVTSTHKSSKSQPKPLYAAPTNQQTMPTWVWIVIICIISIAAAASFAR